MRQAWRQQTTSAAAPPPAMTAEVVSTAATEPRGGAEMVPPHLPLPGLSGRELLRAPGGHWGAAAVGAGRKWRDATALSIAAEAHMNLSPWDYYEVKTRIPNHAPHTHARTHATTAPAPRPAERSTVHNKAQHRTYQHRARKSGRYGVWVL